MNFKEKKRTRALLYMYQMISITLTYSGFHNIYVLEIKQSLPNLKYGRIRGSVIKSFITLISKP